MHLIEKHIIKPSNELYPVLDEMCFKSKNLYNKANYIIRQEFIGNKTHLNYFTLQSNLAKPFPIFQLDESKTALLT